MLDMACPVPYGCLQLGLPIKATILLTSVFTSQYMDYATDSIVSYGICGRIMPLPFMKRDCFYRGSERCAVLQGFCSAFSAASVVDIVVCLILELSDTSPRCVCTALCCFPESQDSFHHLANRKCLQSELYHEAQKSLNVLLSSVWACVVCCQVLLRFDGNSVAVHPWLSTPYQWCLKSYDC